MRCGIDGQAHSHPVGRGRYYVDYRVDPATKVSIIIPNKDQASMLKNCIDSILEKSSHQEFEIVIVENNSVEQETFDLYRQLQEQDSRIIVVTYEVAPGAPKFNFSALINFGVTFASSDYFLLLNNDTQVIASDWIEQLLGPCQRDEVAAVGAKLYYADGTVQHCGVFMGETGASHVALLLSRDDPGYFEMPFLSRNYSALTAACLLVKRSAFEEVGGFDEGFAVDYNDVDFCLRLRDKGHLLVYTPRAKLYHFESITRKGLESDADKIRFMKERAMLNSRWAKYCALGDPYSNPNLICVPVHFQLLW